MNRTKKWKNAFSAAVSFVMVLVLFLSGIPAETLTVSAVESIEESPQTEPETTQAELEQTEAERTQKEEETTKPASETEEKQTESRQTERETESETENVSETEGETQIETETVSETEEETRQTETVDETATEEDEEETETATEEILLESGNSELNIDWINKLKAKFPHGKYWNNTNGVNNPDGWTNSGCGNHSQGKYGILDTCNFVYGADNAGDGVVYHYQCRGFAYKLAKDYYGSCPADGNWSRAYNLNSLKAGDIIHYTTSGGYPHYIWVTKVEGNNIIFADCNSDTHCIIRWDASWNNIGSMGGFKWVWVAPADPHPSIPPKPTKPEIHPTTKFGNDFYAYIRYAVNATYIESVKVNDGDANIVANAQTSGRALAYTYEPEKILHFQFAQNDRFGASYTISNDYGTLDVYGAGANGGNVVVYNRKNGGPNQRWYIDDIGGSNLRFVPVYSYDDDYTPALFLDAATASETDKGVKVRNIQACLEAGAAVSFAQQFSIDIIKDYAEPLTTYGDDFYAYIAFGRDTKEAYIEARETAQDGEYNVQLSLPSDNSFQASYEPRNMWRFIRDKNGTNGFQHAYKVINEHNGQCLDVRNRGQSDGTNVQTCKDNGTDAQRWYLIRGKDGRIQLVPVCCYRTGNYPQGFAMGVANGTMKEGANVELRVRVETNSQKFDIWPLSWFPDSDLKNYKKPSAPAAPASIGVVGNRSVTKIFWDEVQRTGIWDSRMYELSVYEGDSVGSKPIISLTTEQVSYRADNLPKGIYTAQVKTVNAKYKDLVSAPVTKTFKVGDSVEFGFANTGDQILQDGKIQLTASNNESDVCDVNFIAASYTASGKMQKSITMPFRLESGESSVTLPVASLGSCDRIKIFCIDKKTLAPLTDSLIYSENAAASEWVRASDVPAGAYILDEKWTYTETKTETTTSENPAMDGWTQTGSTLRQTGSGTHYYADYPGGFKTDHALYNAYNKSALTAAETDTTKRTVSSASIKDYIYYHWTCNQNRLPNENYNVFIMEQYCWDNGREYFNFRAFESSAGYGHTDPNGRNGGEYFYAWNNDPADGSWWWCRFPVYQQTYTDYKKLFTYERKTTTEYESATAVKESDTISNVVHWVKYQV